MAKKLKEDRAALTPAIISPADVVIAYKQAFAAQEGQIVLADLMRRFGHSRYSTFTKAGGTEQMLLNEGARRVLIHIGIQLDLDPAEVEANEKVEM